MHWRWLLVLILVMQTGCAARRAASRDARTVAVVPGCPTETDGRLSFCLWRRVIWATLLYEEGRVGHFITSGSAVHNRYVEAMALKAGMVALGVPAEVIHTETQALHTDQNMGYSLLIAQELGFGHMAVASDRNQAVGGCAMLRGWGQSCAIWSLDRERVHARRLQPLPDVVADPVPASAWLPLDQREQALAEASGRRWARPRSFPYYVAHGFLGLFGLSGPPEPPVEEPTL